MNNDQNQEIIVTGINGFVGRHLAEKLKQRSYNVHGIGRESAPRKPVDTTLSAYSVGDMLDRSSLENIPFKQASAIIHLAGLASVADSFRYPDLYRTGNATMTENLLSCAYDAGFTGRVVVVSTGALYDPSEPMPIDETSKLSDNSPYAYGKIKAENIAKAYGSKGYDVVIARPFNHIGPGQNRGFLVPDLYEQIIEARETGSKEISVGNLNTKRDYTDVRDIADAYVRLATAKTLQNDIYNICSGRSYSGLDILEIIKKAASAQEIRPVIDQDRVRPTDALDIVGDSSRIQSELKWKPLFSLEKAIVDFVLEKQ